MKKILLLFSIILIGLYNANAQCTVTNVAIQLKSIVSVGDQCQVVFDFSWDEDVNPGNKYACIHLWRSDQYPALEANGLAYHPTSNWPTATDLTNAIATIVIENNGGLTPTIGTQYDPDPTVPVLSNGLDVVKEEIASSNMERMTVRNISLTIPNCTGTSITGDIWASQAENGHNVHCVSSDVSIIVGNPRITGFLNCEIPRQYSTQIKNVGDAPITITYNVYVDEGDGLYEPTAHDLKITTTPIGPYTLAAGQTYNSGLQSYLPYSETKPYSDHDLWVQVITEGFPNYTVYRIENTCSPLPVHLSSFTAIRKNSMVELKWGTSTELNNKGFEIQREIGAGNFQTIAFVATIAPLGNSQGNLVYSFNDFNPTKEISTYRIKQVDINELAKYSEIRLVRGLGQLNQLIIYPNPVVNGNFKILYADPGVNYDVVLSDMNGKKIKQWNNISSNNLFVDNLTSGMYMLQVANRVTNEIVNLKISVLK